ncbi:LysR family transcriptional regulator [Litoreibacter albidus]|uniref:DNA-binding transcriptional regulator, LysR family n=1 Tax=Litoreibacter albidus TaxID=670155 RepID=A0A1H3CMR7_9RHOB|nr:LysR family transcriptional regulator [Litoreibacter albidus]SDX55417.1 DNA-binding transcriptional regulator, LysR family [Litoreibacter albidus]
MLNFTACKYFLEVARLLSIRAAADRLHVAPSAISRQISKLEHEFDVQLLVRHSNGVRLTASGELLAKHMTVVFDRIDIAKGEISDLKGLKTGRVEIATIEGISRPFLSENIDRFRQKYPSIEFRVRIRGRERVLEALEQHLCQIGFIYDNFSHPSIEEVGKWRQPLLAFARPDHPFADGRHLTLEDLLPVRCVLPDDSFGIHHLVKRAYAKLGATPNTTLVADQFHFLIDHAIRTNAIIYLPLQAALTEAQTGQIVPLNLECRDFEHRYIFAIVRRDQQLSPAAAEFLKFVLLQFSKGEKSDAELLAKLRKL